jgi:hypothetical protein
MRHNQGRASVEAPLVSSRLPLCKHVISIEVAQGGGEVRQEHGPQPGRAGGKIGGEALAGIIAH